MIKVVVHNIWRVLDWLPPRLSWILSSRYTHENCLLIVDANIAALFDVVLISIVSAMFCLIAHKCRVHIPVCVDSKLGAGKYLIQILPQGFEASVLSNQKL